MTILSSSLADDCDSIQLIPSEDGSQLVTYVNVSGVVCGSASQPNTRGNTNVYVAMGIEISMLVMIVAVLIGYATVAILS